MAGSFATTLNRFKVYMKQRQESAGPVLEKESAQKEEIEDKSR
jgi:hypothetical protein